MAILDKEFLTFCNATNLDWHFAELVAGKKLHELLSPEKFKRRNKKEEFTGFVYMPNAKNEKTVSAQDKKEGLIAMQARAGVLMNYLEECEKGSGQGDFLKEWEVENTVSS